jgi:hypothetical protein
VIRWACALAVVGGVSRRPMARLCAAWCLRPMTKSSIKRGMDARGAQRPTPEDMLRHRLARTPVTACPLAGSDP